MLSIFLYFFIFVALHMITYPASPQGEAVISLPLEGKGDGELSSQVQHFLEIKSRGERKPRHLRGRELIR